ncbi:MAG: cobalt chelatase, partial [Lachnospiraceae bacterium]|nr:cobalt chelatase [Lachnospiraceae bacterium]
MKKKTLTVFLALAMAATAFTGCGDKKTETTDVTEAVSTESEQDDQAKADEVAALIDAIYVQERTDETDAQC